MNIPGFTAEMSLYDTIKGKYYRQSTTAAETKLSAFIVPADCCTSTNGQVAKCCPNQRCAAGTTWVECLAQTIEL